MGTLNDITERVNNTSTARMAPTSHALSENPSAAKNSPRYMQPTLSSKQSVTTPNDSNNRASTPASIPSTKGSSWMASAAKRMNISRVGDGIPRSKKEGKLSKKAAPGIVFPDKFATPSQRKFDDSRIPTPVSKVAPANKPLPSPPVAQILTTAPEARCLIDASEKPLRRSPPENPGQQEEWPVLFPAKPTEPDAIRSIVQEGGLSKQNASTGELQRHPRILDTSGSSGMKPVKTAVSIQSIPRKIAEKPEHVKAMGTKLLDSSKDKDNGRFSNSKDHNDTDQVTAGMSAADAAIEKRSSESKDLSHPRQTKTSSLRARISNGSITKDGPNTGNKIVGFTDFTTVTENTSNPSAGNLRSSAGSTEALTGRRAPSAIIAGRRRPITHRPHRPSSQTSLRNVSRTFDLPSSGDLPSGATSSLPSRGSGNVTDTITPNVELRRTSFIPVLRQDESLVDIQGSNAAEDKPIHHIGQLGKAKRFSRKPFDIFEGPILESPDANKGRNSQDLSAKDGEYGPTLRVSSSAERVIMGDEDFDKENHPKVRANKCKDLQCQVAVSELHKSAQDAIKMDGKEELNLPLSKDYFLPTDHLQHRGGLPKQYISRLHTLSGGSDDPFFDARSHVAEFEADSKFPSMPEVDIKSDMNNIVRRASSIALGDSIPLNPGFLPATMHEHVSKGRGLPTNDFDLHQISTPEQPKGEGSGHCSASFPPRSSSRAAVPDYTISSVSPHQSEIRLSDEFVNRQNKLGESVGLNTLQLDCNGTVKRDSVAHSSNKSQGSISKGMLSNFRGLFHKRSGDNGVKHEKAKHHITKNGSPFPPMSEIHPIHRPTLASTSRSKRPAMRLDIPNQPPLTPAYQSPRPSELATTTTLAMEILDLARLENSSPKRERYFELGKVMVEAVTQVRDAEKAMMEATQAARKAEVSYLLCAQSVSDIAKKVQEWKTLMGLDA